jgi:hypothetical protein
MTNKLYYYLLTLMILLVGCKKNNTSFYEDNQKNNLSIFNIGNNILTCYINNIAERTIDRISYGHGTTTYEVVLEKQRALTTSDTLLFTWKFENSNYISTYKTLTLHYPVPLGFRSKDFKGFFNGKRLIIDSTVNGYFTTSFEPQIINTNIPSVRGNGVIFFQTASLDSSSVSYHGNIISGLLSAKIGNNIITDGRFDHALNGLPINF